MKLKVIVLFLFFLLIPAIFLSLSLPKDSDDEVTYTGLAAKIADRGLASYNLRGVSIDPAKAFWKLSETETGNYLGIIKNTGADYYDVPLFFNPPLFPVTLAISHQIFNHSTPFYLMKKTTPRYIYFEQFYAAFPNILFGLLFLLGIFFLGRQQYSESVGLWALIFCLLSPVFLVATFKVWTDVLTATLIVWAFYWWKKNPQSYYLAMVAGLLMGLATLTRTSALFALPLFFTRKWGRMLLFYLVLLAVAGWWFFRVYQFYGTPLYFPDIGATKAGIEWFKIISRPWHYYLLDIFYLSPLFLGIFLVRDKKAWIFFIWILLYVGIFSYLLSTSKPLGLEDRYLLPCYPAFAILAASGWVRVRKYLTPQLFFILVAGLGLWSLHLGLLLVISRESLRFVPF